MFTPDQFIEDKGAQKVADATGRSVAAVRVWKHRKRFPRDAWLHLNKAFPELTLDVLQKLEAAAPKRERSAA